MQLQPIFISAPLLHEMELASRRAYPDECCGILLGRDEPSRRVIVGIEAVPNAVAELDRHHRFAIPPLTMLRTEESAEIAGLSVLGFYHSHPDQPARPSEFDRACAWPVYSYLIVSILNGEPADLTSWVLDSETGGFVRQDVIETT